MTGAPKFIYFDLDDTLLNHRQAEARALSDVHRHFDCFAGTQLNELIDTYHRVNKRQWELYADRKLGREELQRNRFEQTLEKLGFDGSLYVEVGSFYMGCYRNHWHWMEGAKQAYDAIREVFPVGILTNGFSETQKKKFDKFAFYDTADHLVISEDIGVLKPDPKIFEYATALADCRAEEILYVGDSYRSDVLGGSSFGWNVAWFVSNGEYDGQEEPSLVFQDFNKLCDFLEIEV